MVWNKTSANLKFENWRSWRNYLHRVCLLQLKGINIDLKVSKRVSNHSSIHPGEKLPQNPTKSGRTKVHKNWNVVSEAKRGEEFLE